jgi:hypothetical protein
MALLVVRVQKGCEESLYAIDLLEYLRAQKHYLIKDMKKMSKEESLALTKRSYDALINSGIKLVVNDNIIIPEEGFKEENSENHLSLITEFEIAREAGGCASVGNLLSAE